MSNLGNDLANARRTKHTFPQYCGGLEEDRLMKKLDFLQARLTILLVIQLLNTALLIFVNYK